MFTSTPDTNHRCQKGSIMDEAPLILLVEDDAYDARLTRRALEKHDFRLEHVERGDQVVEAVRTLNPDLVLLDLMLPVMTGIEACKAMRTFSDVPVIMLTGLDDDEDQVAGLGSGADDYISKPVVERLLVARITSLLRRTRRLAPGTTETLEAGPLRIDEDLRQVTIDDSADESSPAAASRVTWRRSSAMRRVPVPASTYIASSLSWWK